MGTLRFIESPHSYLHDGEPIPGITQILSEMGLMGDYQPDPWYLERGRLVHLACEYLDKDGLDWDSLDDEIRSRVEAYQKFKKDYDFKPRMIEQPVHNHRLNVACTPDREGNIKWHDAVVELKNGGRQKWHRLQLAIQAICIGEDGGRNTHHRYTLELKTDSTYKILRFEEDESDRKAAESLVTLYHWLKEGKRK